MTPNLQENDRMLHQSITLISCRFPAKLFACSSAYVSTIHCWYEPVTLSPSASPRRRNDLLKWLRYLFVLASAVLLFLSISVSLEMAVVPKGKNIVNDTTPMMCTIEGIAKKEHVVRSKLVLTVLSQRAPNISAWITLTYKLLMFLFGFCPRIILWRCNGESTMTTLGRFVWPHIS